MTAPSPLNPRRVAVYATGINRAWHVTGALKATALCAWAGVTYGLLQGPLIVEKEVRIPEPFARLDLEACRNMVARNRDFSADRRPVHVPTTHTHELHGETYNPKDNGIAAAHARGENALRLERQRAYNRRMLELYKRR